MTATDVCNMINNYKGTQEERDAIIAGIRPAARNIAAKHWSRTLIKVLHTIDDLEMLIYVHVLKMLQKGKTISNCSLNKVLYCGLIDELRAEERRIKRNPNMYEVPLDIYEYGDNFGVDYLNTDMIDFLDDLARCNNQLYRSDIFNQFKNMFIDYIFNKKDMAWIGRYYGYTSVSALCYILHVAKVLCDAYSSDYMAARDIVLNYDAIDKAPKERCRYGRLMDCKALSVPAFDNRE